MGKIKSILVVLLTVVLLIGGSLLPTAATRIQDKTAMNMVQYENIEALQLRLEEEALSMTYPEKMFLMMHGSGMDVTDEDTRIKEKHIMETTYTAIAPYMDLFLGGSFDNDYLEYYPVMVYDESNPSRYAYYWHVILSLDMSENDTVSVVLDDETGKVIAIEMIDPDMMLEPEYSQKLQYTLEEIYLGELGIFPDDQWPLALESADAYGDPAAMDMTVAATQYRFADPVYGDILVQIGVRTDGFYIYLV